MAGQPSARRGGYWLVIDEPAPVAVAVAIPDVWACVARCNDGLEGHAGEQEGEEN